MIANETRPLPKVRPHDWTWILADEEGNPLAWAYSYATQDYRGNRGFISRRRREQIAENRAEERADLLYRRLCMGTVVGPARATTWEPF